MAGVTVLAGALAGLGALGWFLTGQVASQCQDFLIQIADAQQCATYTGWHAKAGVLFVIAAAVFVVGLAREAGRR